LLCLRFTGRVILRKEFIKFFLVKEVRVVIMPDGNQELTEEVKNPLPIAGREDFLVGDSVGGHVARKSNPDFLADTVPLYSAEAQPPVAEDKRIETPEQMRRFLKEQEGLKFLPRERTILIPEIDDKQLLPVFGDSRAARDAIECFTAYLDSDSIKDRFGNNHEGPGGRRAWRTRLEEGRGKEFGKLFRDVYYPNQLRKNIMGGVQMSIQNIALTIERRNNMEETPVSVQLRGIATKLGGALIGVGGGKPYKDMTEDEKLQTVRLFEDETANVLWTLARPGADVKEIMVT